MALSTLALQASAQEIRKAIPPDQQPLLKVFPPPANEQSQPGVGKFVIFTREQVGKDWDFIAGAWECIPSLPEKPVIKRVEFCHSSWNCRPLLDGLVADNNKGLHPRFMDLQVDSAEHGYTVNLYDINYRSWDVRCIWQGNRLNAFGVLGDSIFVETSGDWTIINASTGKLSREIPFVPLETDGDFWLVRKLGETEGCWTYGRRKNQYVAHFGAIDWRRFDFSCRRISSDGKNRALLLANRPDNWRGGSLAGQLILQRHGEKEDISVPVKMRAVAGSGVPVIPMGIQLSFAPDGKLQLRARAGNKYSKDRVWTIDVPTGHVTSTIASHSDPKSEDRRLDGVPVPDYLRQDVNGFSHFGRSGLSPAFLMHLGILKHKPEYPDCEAGVSRDGRHILYKARHGPLSEFLIYGDTSTKKTIRWKWPNELKDCDSTEFVWVETPLDGEAQKRGSDQH